METITLITQRIKSKQHGANMVEYALLAALIALVAIGAVRTYGEKVHDKLDLVNTEWEKASQP